MQKTVTSVTNSGNATMLSITAPGGDGGQYVWKAGDWIAVWNGNQTILRGRARIIAPQSTATYNATLTLDRVITGVNFDDYVVNESKLNRGMLVRRCNNWPLSSEATGRLRTPTVFQDNHFDGTLLRLMSEDTGNINTTRVAEGPEPRDFLFENCYFKGPTQYRFQPLQVWAGSNIIFKNCTIDTGKILLAQASKVYFDHVDWINNPDGTDALKLQQSSFAWVFNQSSRNNGPVVAADAELLENSVVFLEAPPGYPPPNSGYGQWTQDYNLWGSNAATTNDFDSDGMNSLLEYALGGDPTQKDAASVHPKFYLGGGNWFYYVFEKRNDPNLTYSPQSSTDLVSGTWAADGVELVSESAMLNNFKTVTYRVPMAGKSRQFFRLKVDP
jgi:hypothetical protein